MAEPVKYVPFGGAQVPEGTRREVIDRNGQKIYCVWTDNKGVKITYPEQRMRKPNQKMYIATQYEHEYFSREPERVHSYHVSKAEFEYLWNDNSNDDIKTDYKGRSVEHHYYGQSISRTTLYKEYVLDTTPTIEVYKDTGMIYDTQNVTLSNMKGATVTGSTNEDNITLMNSSNCTVDVSNANNNMFVSDNVRVVNGQGNKVKAGDHDHVTFGTHNYETNTDTTKANHKGEGTYRQ